MTAPIDIKGRSLSELAPVKAAFAVNFAEDLDLGARFSVVRDGEVVFDHWAGVADRASGAPWTDETIAAIYSSGKAVCACLVAQLVEDGALEYDRPVADYWPEFAAAGKASITVAQVMSHQGGLCGFTEEFPSTDWLDWPTMVGKIEAMAPLWSPGEKNGYHPQTFGIIVGELIRRVSGRSVGAHLRAAYADDPLNSVHCGFADPISEFAATMTKPPRAPDLGPINPYREAAFLKRWSSAPPKPVEAWRAAEIPASNMHATALGLARTLQPLAGAGGLSEQTLDAAFRIRIAGDDLVLPFHLQWAAGLFVNPDGAYGPDPSVFCHSGFGGSCIVVDRKRRLTAAYVMNKMSPSLIGDERPRRLLWALYEALGQ
ncbi:MAG: serine hydrolase domain-containing protein [Pseudomonadota bacterium]